MSDPKASEFGLQAEDSASEEVTLEALERELGHSFRDRGLLEIALRHSSYAHENPDAVGSNQRLEFLGDAVLGLVVAHRLYEAHPDWQEGDLTRALHRLVDQPGLAELGRRLGVGRHLRLGRTERRTSGQTKSKILADALEAVVGAMYLDGGLEAVERLTEERFAAAFAPDAARVERDPKTEFQEWAMERFGEFPVYEQVLDSEIEGDEQRFTFEARVQGECLGRGAGRAKRNAERAAAEDALAHADARRDE